jgi:hypothetical protein
MPLARPYPHGFDDPLRIKGRYVHLASKLAKREGEARKLGQDPSPVRAMLGVMNIHMKRKKGPLGSNVAYRDMLQDMATVWSGGGKINLKEALEAWKR